VPPRSPGRGRSRLRSRTRRPRRPRPSARGETQGHGLLGFRRRDQDQGSAPSRTGQPRDLGASQVEGAAREDLDIGQGRSDDDIAEMDRDQGAVRIGQAPDGMDQEREKDVRADLEDVDAHHGTIRPKKDPQPSRACCSEASAGSSGNRSVEPTVRTLLSTARSSGRQSPGASPEKPRVKSHSASKRRKLVVTRSSGCQQAGSSPVGQTASAGASAASRSPEIGSKRAMFATPGAARRVLPSSLARITSPGATRRRLRARRSR